MFSILRPYIFSLDPEAAHDLAIKSLKLNFLPKGIFKVENEQFLETQLLNKKIPNPIGLAAGFDKSAEVYNSLFKLGYGFVEVGTVTPKRQLGNPKPRIFRLEKDQALINRLGFNNHGSEIVSKRIAENLPIGFLGINVGPNKDTKNKEQDYYLCLSKLSSQANYILESLPRLIPRHGDKMLGEAVAEAQMFGTTIVMPAKLVTENSLNSRTRSEKPLFIVLIFSKNDSLFFSSNNSEYFFLRLSIIS